MKNVTNDWVASPEEAQAYFESHSHLLQTGETAFGLSFGTTPWKYFTVDSITDLRDNRAIFAERSYVPLQNLWQHMKGYLGDQIKIGRGVGGPLVSQRGMFKDNHSLVTIENVVIESVEHIKKNWRSDTAAYSCVVRDTAGQTCDAIFLEGAGDEFATIPSHEVEIMRRDAEQREREDGNRPLYNISYNLDFYVLSKKTWGTLLPAYHDHIKNPIFIVGVERDYKYNGGDDNNDFEADAPTPLPSDSRLVSV